MLLEFFATIAAGAGAAGIILALQKLLRLPLPKWLIPATAGITMLALTIWLDYTWFPRAQAGLGPDKIVATKVERKRLWRPWTYLYPVTTRFIALDQASAVIDGATIETDMYLLARRSDSAIVPVAFDCLLSRRADTVGLPAGDLSGAEWFGMDQEDPLLRTACDRLR